MDRDHVSTWVNRYERAWRSPGTDALADLFTEDASYSKAPYRESLRGLPAIAEMWEAERDGPDEVFTMRAEVVAEQGDRGVARVHVVYGDPPQREYRDLWVITFDEAGRATVFEEWPFSSGRPRAAAARGT
jgi:ketosteroid isomerase-like protein